MRLKSVEVTNMFQHKHRKFTLDGNLIGVIGPNGSGKSNFLNCIHYAFGGEVPGKTKEQLTRWGSESGEVTVGFDHSGTEGVITRGVGKNTATFKFGEDKRTGITRVAAGIQENLGLDKDVLRMMFVRQAELDAVLFEAPGKRETAFQRMCGIGDAARVHKRIGELLSEKFPPLPNFDEQIAVAVAEQAEQTKQMAQLKSAAADIERRLAETSKQQLMQDRSMYLELSATAKSAYSSYQLMEQARRAIEADQSSIAALDNQLGTVTLETVDAEIQRVRDSIDRHKTYQRLCDDWTKKKQALSELGAAPCTDSELADLKAMADQITDESSQIDGTLEFHKKLMTSLTSAEVDVTACPLCGSEVSNLNILRQRLEQEIAACMQRKSKLDRNVVSRYKDLNDRLNQHRFKSQVLQTAFDDADALLAAAERSSENIDKLEADINGMIAVRTDLSRLFQQRSQCEARADLQTRQYEQHKTAYDKAISAIACVQEFIGMELDRVIATVQERVIAADAALAGIQQHEVRLATINGQMGMLHQQINTLTATIADLRDKRSKQDTYNEVTKTLVDVRNWFHYAAGPHDLSISVLTELTEDVNAFLARLNAPFSVVAEDAGMAYKCVFTDGRATSVSGPPDASELSGGEKVMLAISFRLASYIMFAGRLGVLVLDEPSAYLDDNNISNLCTLLGKIKEVAAALNLQIIIVTHERSLLPFFDSVLDLSPESGEKALD